MAKPARGCLLLPFFLAAGCASSNGAEPTRATQAPSAAPAGATPARPAPTRAAPAVFEASAVAGPVRQTRLSPKAAGVLASIKVREGAWVTAGQVLCQLDTADLQIRAEAATIVEAQAAENAKIAALELQRAEALFKAGSMPEQQIERARVTERMAQLQVESARTAVRAARQAIADATLRAPFAGVVTKVLAEEGQAITAVPPTVVFHLVDASSLDVRVPVPERLIGQVKTGMPVEVQLPALGIELEARVHALPAVIDPATRSAEAIVRLDNRDHALAAGLYARVRFPEVRLAAAGLESGVKEGSL